jgi:hypothetical protein
VQVLAIGSLILPKKAYLMGADMTLHCVPACELTPRRIANIEQLIQSIPGDDVDLCELMDQLGYKTVEQAKRCLLRECLNGQSEHRQIVTLHIPGCSYLLRAAGGLSWGDPPNEGYTTLEHVERCPQLRVLMEQFAREDFQALRLEAAEETLVDARQDVTVILTSQELGSEIFRYDSVAEALAAIERLASAAEQLDDGIERLIGIVVNPGQSFEVPRAGAGSRND